jgi:hypothetical protein
MTKKAKKGKKEQAPAAGESRALVAASDVLRGALEQAGLRAVVDKDYIVPLVNRRHVLWMKFKGKDGRSTITPYVLHAGLLDVLHQRGFKELSCKGLDPRRCVEMGHYNADAEKDFCLRSACTVVLKNGRTMTLEGDACKHNVQGVAGTAMARMAETRAIGRVVRRLCNISAVAVCELGRLDDLQEARLGDKVLDSGGVREVIDADFTVETPADGNRGFQAAEAAETRAKAHRTDQRDEKAWNAVNRTLHAMLTQTGTPIRGFHAWVKANLAKGGRAVGSFQELTVEELQRVHTAFMGLNPEKLDAVKAWATRWEERNPQEVSGS